MSVETYACGNTPKAGDLVEFGTRHLELLVTQVLWDGDEVELYCGSHRYKNYSLTSMILLARHGEERKWLHYNKL